MRAPAAHLAPLQRFSVRAIPLIAASLLIAAVSYATPIMRPGAVRPGPVMPPAELDLPGEAGIARTDSGAADLNRIGAAISTWTANLERDPADFIASTNLASLYLARAQLTGAADDYARALTAVDRALETDGSLLAARVLRAQVLFASHDFAGAERAATAILEEHAGLPQALATLGDARFETGDYDGATAAYEQIAGPPAAPVLARHARLAAVTGSLDLARTIAAEASALAESNPMTTAADQSFYRLLAGALALQAGDTTTSLEEYRAAVETWPDSPAALAGLGRAQAATGNMAGAIASYERAVAIRPEPATLSALGDLLLLAGRKADAEVRHDQVRGIAAIQGEAGLVSRAIVQFLADHGESADRAVTLAAAELEMRADVYGWDTYAWALFAAGRFAEADAAMIRARAHGTEDALLDYHAGMIAAALGRDGAAADLLWAALDRNPAFDAIGAARARATMARLQARP